jgi:CHAD domain-containing protein
MQLDSGFAETILDHAEAATLTGDVRDALLTHVRGMRVPWAMLAEDEQQEIIDAISKTAESSVRATARLIVHQKFQHLDVRLGKWTVKDGVKIEILTAATVQNITALAEHSGGAVLVLTDASEFFGERGPAKADKQQPDLPLK